MERASPKLMPTYNISRGSAAAAALSLLGGLNSEEEFNAGNLRSSDRTARNKTSEGNNIELKKWSFTDARKLTVFV